jgi:hypothetical protein
MFSKLAAAAIAVSLIAGPALAQNGANPPVTTQQRSADVGATGVKKVAHVKRHTAKRHVAKAHRHIKHVKVVKHVKHVKHLKQVKRINAPVKNKTAG